MTVKSIAGGLGSGAANCVACLDANGNFLADSSLTYNPNTGEMLNAANVETGITASTTQTQVGGYALTKRFSIVATAANTNDAVTLPTGTTGRTVTVVNNGANTIKIFPPSGGNISGAGANTAVTQATTVNKTYYCYDGTNWATL